MKAGELRKLREIKGRLAAVRRTHPDPFEKGKGNLEWVTVLVCLEQEWLARQVKALVALKRAALSAEDADRLRGVEGRQKRLRAANRDEFERKSFLRSLPAQFFLDSDWLVGVIETAGAGVVEADDAEEFARVEEGAVG
jgi:hypothetical protein